MLGTRPLRVNHDHAEMVRLAVEYLVGQGRRRIGLLESGDPHHFAAEHPVRDLFRKELARHGLAFREEWYRGDLHACWPGAGWEEFREIWQTEEKPDALFIADDVLAQDVALALVEMGLRVPRDLEVVAHANQGSEVRFPFPVALVENDPDAHAKGLVDMALALLRDPAAPVTPPTLSCRLIAPETLRRPESSPDSATPEIAFAAN
jgi:LacI family transcriptional regulator